jgi:signal transduction histidine kinase
MGFERARFWEVAWDAACEEQLAVLTDRLPADATGEPPGYVVAWDQSDIVASRKQTSSKHGKLHPVQKHSSADSSLSKIERDLDLGGRTRVEVPVTAGADTESVLACDWSGERRLSESDLAALRLVGSLLGSHLALKSSSGPRTLAQTAADKDDRLPTVDGFVLDAAERLREQVDAAFAAVFEFRWSSQSLVKIRQLEAPEYKQAAKRQGALAESYPAGGPALTGRTWRDEQLRHVVSFPRLKDCLNPLIDEKSEVWHTRVLGKDQRILTVLYGVVGNLERRYLIRLINRASRPDLPFLREAHEVEAAINELGADVDAAISLQRLKSLHEISGVLEMSGDAAVGVDDVVTTIAEALKKEGVTAFAALCHQQGSPQFSFARFLGLDPAPQFDLTGRWADDPLYSTAIGTTLSVLSLQEHRSQTSQGAGVADALTSAAKAVLVQPMQAGYTRGAMFICLDYLPPRAQRMTREEPEDLGYGTTALLHAYSRLLANAVEMHHSQERVLGSRRAYGFMGHEVRRPGVALGSAALKAIVAGRAATDALPDVPLRDDLTDRLDKAHVGLRRAQRRLEASLDLSKIVARESEGTLRLRFEPADLSNVLKLAVDDADLQIREDVDRWTHHFLYRGAAEKLGTWVCSEAYLEIAIRNIVINAVKYSLPVRPAPAGGRASARIELIGEPQTRWIGIKIRNWGWPIPGSMIGSIFEPWVRGYTEEDVEALPGMGLGLFLSRRLIAAHLGEILCYSTPTEHRFFPRRSADTQVPGLREPRREPVIIHETVFEIRIPKDLEPGPRTHHWEGAPVPARDQR